MQEASIEMKPAVCLLLPLGLYPPRPLCALAKYLAVSRRNDTTKFGFPGGKEDPEEGNLMALIREVFEEVGLVIRPDELVPLYSGVCPGEGPDDTYWVTAYLWKRAPGPLDRPLKLEPGLVSDWRTEAQLTDPRSSPFAAYNVAVFNAYRQYLQSGLGDLPAGSVDFLRAEQLTPPTAEGQRLSDEETAFVLQVFNRPGAKLQVPLGVWDVPEKLGLVQTVGSWKWEPTALLVDLVHKSIQARVRGICAGLRYNVEVDRMVRHPGCTAEDVMRALGHYHHRPGYTAQQSSTSDTARSGC